MQLRPLVVLAIVLMSAPACKKKEAPPVGNGIVVETTGANFGSVTLAPSSGELKSLLAAEAAKAKAKGFTPFVEVRADWCDPCKKLEASMTDPRMVDAFAGTYQIKLDADAWENKLAGAGIKADAIPVFYELDASGKPTGRSLDGGAWGDDVPENMAPALKKFFHP
jgi:thiol-disulfide isomerase/thioredoxin